MDNIMDIQKSSRKNKKYMVEIDGKTIHFGDNRYQHYKDRTSLKLYSHLDHNDKKRRMNYFKRHSGVSTKKQALEKELTLSGGELNAKILSHLYLW